MTGQPSISEFLAAFFPDEQETVWLRCFDPKDAPYYDDKHAQKIKTSRRRLSTDKVHLGALQKINRKQGVYFVVNAGGNRAEEITRFNAFFAEMDDRPIEEQQRTYDQSPIRPPIRIETKKSVHGYWPAEPCSAEDWRAVQRGLIDYFKSDPKIKDPSRVMRLCGFDHVSQNCASLIYKPILVSHFQATRRFTASEMLAAFPSKPEMNATKGSTIAGEYQDWDELNSEARRRIITHKTANTRPDGWIHCKGVCHGGKSNSAIALNPASGAYHCTSGHCTTEDILRGLGLPDRPTGSRCEVSAGPVRREPGDDSETEPWAGTEEEVRPTKYSDDAIADQFSARNAPNLKFVDKWGWLEWAGHRWRRVPDVVVMDLARPICRAVAQLCKDDPDIPRQSTREGLARSIASAKTVAAVERLARGDARHYSEVDKWDADLWAFNTPGGTVDLKTGLLRPHRRDDLITKVSNATPRGDCPRFKAFLDRITGGDGDVQGYLQRLAGYGQVGDPREECLDFFYGKGGNGKGTFLATLEYAFGEYATVAGAETFTEARGDKHPCDVAKLAGARLVISNEVDENQRWDEARIKNLTGRDKMTARFMRQDFFDFLPQFTLIIAGNHKPTLKTVDESIRRRFHLVPFNITIPVEEQNTSLKAELRQEADGVLAWCVQGCLEWQRQRLNPPPAVLAATADYLESEDVFEMWLTECCLRGDQFEDETAWLYESFKIWKDERGEGVPGRKTFTNRLTSKEGIARGRDMHGWKMIGLRLTPTERIKVTKIMAEKNK